MHYFFIIGNSSGILEQAMSTAALTQRKFCSASRWNQLTHEFAEWRRRARSRDELYGLSDASLRDIGLTRCDVAREASKPFWMA